jgi:hypothetical protein
MNNSFLYDGHEVIKVRLSTSFLIRSKCIYCKSGPSVYFYIQNPILWFNHRKVLERIEFLKRNVKRFGGSHFLKFDPKYFIYNSHFNQSINFKGYNPKLHRTRGNYAISITEYLQCNCGRMSWAFSEKSIQNRDDILSRKSRFKFPNKFDF